MNRRTLIVAIRGWTDTGDTLLFGQPGGEFPASTVDALQAQLVDAVVWTPDLDLPMFTMRSADSVAKELYDKINNKVDTMPDVESIVLLGYSAGTVLARRVFCMAHGAIDNGELSGQAAWWALKIHRLVVLAGITRGWEFSTASPDHVRFLSPVLLGLARMVGWWKSRTSESESKIPFIWQLKRGSPFIIATRIQYINVMAALRQKRSSQINNERLGDLCANQLPSTVFLLGARDEYISPADCTELGARDEFVYIELKGANHTEVLEICGNDTASELRRERILAALTQDFNHLRQQAWALPAEDIDDYLDPMDLSENGASNTKINDRVQHAIIVVHGIRDNGFWTKRVAREIKTLARRESIVVRAPSPSYGFFSMWDFIRPGGRESATYWFMERYADVRSHFPNAEISFVGHSNGTYLAAYAMKLCPAIKFCRVVFAGSVVRRDYQWGARATQARGVLNYVGNLDRVVAFLPAVFELLGLRGLDVGGAGAFGFREAEPPPAIKKTLPAKSSTFMELTEVRFVHGGHGAAIGEDFWPEIAEFVLQNRIPPRQPVTREKWTTRLFVCAPLITAGGVLLAAFFLFLPLIVAAALPYVIEEPSVVGVCIAITAVSGSLAVSWLAGRVLKAW